MSIFSDAALAIRNFQALHGKAPDRMTVSPDAYVKIRGDAETGAFVFGGIPATVEPTQTADLILHQGEAA